MTGRWTSGELSARYVRRAFFTSRFLRCDYAKEIFCTDNRHHKQILCISARNGRGGQQEAKWWGLVSCLHVVAEEREAAEARNCKSLVPPVIDTGPNKRALQRATTVATYIIARYVAKGAPTPSMVAT